jgi:hypothetical protein
MKKIFLLLAISISILSATAQSLRNKSDNQQVKSSQLASNVASTDGLIENITVYPNPVVDELKISFRISHRSTAKVSLFNNIGKQIYTQETDVEFGNNIISIDIRSKSIEPGVYFIQIVSENQTITRKLIVK